MNPPLKLPDNRSALAGVLLLSLGVKLALMLSGKTINTDGILYVTAAKYFEAGEYKKGLTLFHMPAYPFLLHLVYAIIPDWVGAARAIAILAYSAAIIPLYGMTRALFSSQAAIWAAVLFALSPLVNIKTMDVIRDPLFILCLAIYLYCMVAAIQKCSLQWVAASFIAAIFGLLFRIEALVLLVVPILYLLVVALGVGRQEARRWARAGLMGWLLAMGLMASLAVFGVARIDSANIIRGDEIFNHWRALTSLAAFDDYRAIYVFFKSAQQNPPFADTNSSIVAVIRHWMPLVYLYGLTVAFLKVLFPVYLLPLIIALKMLWRRQIKGNAAINFTILLFGAYFLFIYYAYLTRDSLPSRLLFPLVFMLFGLLGQGMEAGLASPAARLFPKVTIVVVILCFLIAPIGRAADKTLRADHSVRSVGLWLQARQALVGKTILSSEPKVLFYADKIEDYYQDREICDRLKDWQTEANHIAIERYALDRKVDAIILLIKERSESFDTLYTHFHPIKVFPGIKGHYVIFSRSDN